MRLALKTVFLTVGSGGVYQVKVRMPAASLAPFIAGMGLRESDPHRNALDPDPELEGWDPDRGTTVVSFEQRSWAHDPVDNIEVSYDVQGGDSRTVWIKAL